MTEPGLFELEAVVVGQPRRSRWRRYVGPALAVSTVDGTPLAQVTQTDDTHCDLTQTSGELLVHIEQFGPAEFRFTNAAQQEVGTADARGLVKTRQLNLHTERGRPLLLTRPGVLNTEWHLTRADPKGDPAPEILGRVTVNTIDSWLGLQQYLAEMDPQLAPRERQSVLATVVCLHLLRRPPGNSASPA